MARTRQGPDRSQRHSGRARAGSRLDLKLGWRGLRRRPGFFLLVVVVLAAGIGSATAGFGVLEATQIRPMPFHDPARLINITLSHRSRPLEAESVYRQDLFAFAEHTNLFEGTGAFRTGVVDLSDEERPERFDAAFITPELFPLLGVHPVVGRGLMRADAAPGAAQAVLISDALWRGRYGAATDIVGRAIRVNLRPATIVGVMPPGFAFPYRQQVWMPLVDVTPGDAQDTSRAVAIARLRPGVTSEVVTDALTARIEESRRRYWDRYEGYRLRVQPLSWYFVDWQARDGQRLLFVAVMALLLVSIANVAGLLLTHARQRDAEWALRRALGAGRGSRLISSISAAAIVAGASLLFALPLAAFALRWLEGELLLAEDPSPYFLDLGLTPLSTTFALLAAIAAAVVAGAAPALRVGSASLAGEIGPGARSTGSRAAARLSGAIVASQLAFSVVIVVGITILVQAVVGMGRRDIGADRDGVLTARVAIFDARYPEPANRAIFWNELGRRLRAASAVRSAAIGTAVPGFTGYNERVAVSGAEAGRDLVRASVGIVDPFFLETYGTTLAAGRAFTALDRADSQQVAVVDRRFAEAAWPGLDPLGRRVRIVGLAEEWLVVVGLVENLHLAQVDDPPRGTVLLPLDQHPQTAATVAMRVTGDPYAAVPVLQQALGEVDPELPLYAVRSLEDAIDFGHATVRIYARLLGWLAVSALLICAAGIYGLLSTRVAERTREIGVRRALGATGTAIGRAVLRQVTLSVAGGLAAGALLAWPIARALITLEPTVFGAGAGTYALAVGVLVVSCLLALAGPLARALAIDPTEALRHE